MNKQTRKDFLDASYPLLEGLEPHWLQSALPHVALTQAEYGATLMQVGEVDASMLVLLDGRLSVKAGELELDEVFPDSSVGGGQLLGDAVRPWQVRTIAVSRLLAVDAEGYQALLEQKNPLAYRLEQTCIKSLAGRLGELDDRIRRLAMGMAVDEAKIQEPPGFWSRLWDQLGSAAGGGGINLDTAAALKRCKHLADISDGVLDRLARWLRPVHFKSGQPLVLQGAGPDNVYLVLEGEAEALVAVDSRLVAHAGDDGPGQVVGLMSALREAAHSATVVARERVLALEVDADAWRALMLREDALGSAVRRMAIRSMAAWIANARWTVEELQENYLSELTERMDGLYQTDSLDEAYTHSRPTRESWTRR